MVGRGTAGARVVLPGLAGMLGVRYRVFVLWTGVAATVWARLMSCSGTWPGLVGVTFTSSPGGSASPSP